MIQCYKINVKAKIILLLVLFQTSVFHLPLMGKHPPPFAWAAGFEEL